MSLERILICPCGHYLERHGKRDCIERPRHDERTFCDCVFTRAQIVDYLIKVEHEEIRSQWVDKGSPA
jgi:hypothetical protein